MFKRFLTILLIFFAVSPVFAIAGANIAAANFADMEKLWCTIDFKHWATSYPSAIGYQEKDFYLYLDENNKKVYNEDKKEVAEVVSFDEKEIKFVNRYHLDKKSYVENFSLNRYTGRAKGEGTIRHDFGKWASITYENRDFNANGQCALVSETRKF